MSEAIQHSPSAFQPNGMADYSKDVKVWAEFFVQPVHMPFKSQQEGAPIYENRDFIRIQQRGERDQIVREVKQEDKARFAQQWAAYQQKASQQASGTPLSVLFPDNPSAVKSLEALQILTVQHLAEASEVAIGRMGLGGRDNVQRAQRYLEAARTGAPNHRLEAQVAELSARLATLEAANKRLSSENSRLESELESATAPNSRRRG
jgi:hypothetical protein